jgi:1-acyl-sn-glycerol-3-phosphate acyltransferase
MLPYNPSAMFRRLNYRLARAAGQFIFFNTVRRVEVIRPEAAARAGPFVLACTHISHLDPFCLSILIRRKIDWMARSEFFRNGAAGRVLHGVDTFPVRRHGVPVSAIRTALRRLEQGRVVGIFPEGGVASGDASACRRGPIKQGACFIAQRAGVPVVPAVIVGTHLLNCVKPWLPARRIRLWVAFGRPIHPAPLPPGRRQAKAARGAMNRELQAEFISVYDELRRTYDLDAPYLPFESIPCPPRASEVGGVATAVPLPDRARPPSRPAVGQWAEAARRVLEGAAGTEPQG